MEPTMVGSTMTDTLTPKERSERMGRGYFAMRLMVAVVLWSGSRSANRTLPP